ncbi:MAG TPA: MarR family transcriptional regulator [Candidatus Blautia excrementipullorum]|nr:MarR family transcriptional regulator [Candidatus Blautia excrementipullorum]
MKDKLLNLFAEYLEKQDALSKLTDHEKLHEYGYSEIHVVAAIGDLQNPNVTSIAKHMKMTKGAVSKIIKRLLSADVIKSYQHEDNKQKIFYSLAEKGRFLYDEHKKRHELWLQRDRRFLDKYSEKQLELIRKFMVDFNLYLQEQIDEKGGQKNAG